MKLTGITGTGTGKLGTSIFAVNAGTQIVRQYQPVVTNPSTAAQIEQRAKLKLASQLARDMKGAIAIPKDGIVSARNRFMSKNFGSITYAGGTASATLAQIQLTEGSLYMPALTKVEAAPLRLAYQLTFDGGFPVYEHYVVSVFVRNDDGSLSLKATMDYKRSSLSPYENTCYFAFDGITPEVDDIVFIYAYNFTSENARASYGDLSVNSDKTIASLIATSALLASNIAFSRTKEGVAVALSE